MKRTMFAVGVLALAPSAVRAGVCDDLRPKDFAGKWAIAPLQCAAGTESACAELLHGLINCLRDAGVDVLPPGALTAAIDEQALRAVVGSGDMQQLRKVASVVPSTHMVVGELTPRPSGALAMLRLIQLSEGRIVTGARVSLTDKGALEKAIEEKRAQGPEVRAESIEVGLRMLADRLAQGYAAMQPEWRYKRLALLTFEENGSSAREQQLGKLVAAELITRLTKDHGMILVERARLAQVLSEFELSHQGVVDEKSAPELGKMLGADAVVLGSVSEAGATYLVHAQVVDAESALTVVAESVGLQAQGLLTLASEAVVLRTRGGAVYRSILLPGWGQFYNREENKALAFGVVAGTLVAGAVTTQLLATRAERDYDRATAGADFASLAQKVDNYHLARNVSLVLLGVTWAYNVLDAYLNGKSFDSAFGTSVGADAATTGISW